ncbi:MAG: heme o synthase [Alphaproteobacteria bacterium]|nr:heme o synthase [Alphaproteobacteria bacterium]
MTDTNNSLGHSLGAIVGGDFALRDYVALLKPRVMSLSIFTAFVGMVLAPEAGHPALMAAALFCIALGAGAAGAINMWLDRDIDAVMTRTSNRPIPTGRVSAEAAIVFGVVLAIAAVMLLGLVANWLAAGLLAATIGFYVVIYTMWLKRRTPQNIVIGGAAGALPPIVGWAAASGDVSFGAVALFALIFVWTPPHFWALALYRNEDFARAKLPMLPLVKGATTTKRHIFAYAALLIPTSALPVAAGIAGPLYLAIALSLSAMFALKAYRLMNLVEAHHDRAAKNLFGFSILYLFALFAALIVEPALHWALTLAIG